MLKWFTKTSKFGEDFNDNELLWSFRSFCCVMLVSVLVQQAFLLLDKELNRKNCVATFYVIPGLIRILKIPVIYIIKILEFKVNSKFTEVTLNSFIFIMGIFCTSSTTKFGIIGITHEVSFCLLHYEFASEK